MNYEEQRRVTRFRDFRGTLQWQTSIPFDDTYSLVNDGQDVRNAIERPLTMSTVLERPENVHRFGRSIRLSAATFPCFTPL
jgi:hypothetical protein